ncbi:hypothetical protein [Flavobacterium piscis]|uniref:Uncharacterized protein n=1 Tax=Flavobacterium piscis TaxID=1114874 RepID=A0ABU1YCY8_9FLAO|nr:hypothetical protein [Flavobacterium piscis]MDR7212106.1 hypothetical protein [Flavobacterium piscis]
MTIQQYLDKIKTLSISGSIGKHSDYADLEDTVIEILADNNKSYFNLFDLEFRNDKKECNEEIILNPEIINQFTDCLGLLLINEKETEGNICFINSTELRPEFRQSFTSIDLLDYCNALLYSAFNKFSEINAARIPITSDSSVFWKLVNYGSGLRNNNSLR